jgi:hypothetical protein
MGHRFDHCPHCGVSLQGDAIPEDVRHYYGQSTHWRRDLAVHVQGVYDGALYQCPDCDGRWHRWPKGTRQHGLAVPFIPTLTS